MEGASNMSSRGDRGVKTSPGSSSDSDTELPVNLLKNQNPHIPAYHITGFEMGFLTPQVISCNPYLFPFLN